MQLTPTHTRCGG